MRLYKIELYKLCHRKIFVIGIISIAGILLLNFFGNVFSEKTVVNGIVYTGYEAIQKDREITEPYKGVLTDEKVEQIVEKYGLSDQKEENRNLENDNFLTQFVGEYLFLGSMDKEGNTGIMGEVWPIAESGLGKVMELSGKGVVLEYYKGWGTYLGMLQLGMILGSILILCSLSVVFANERQTGMLALLFTTKEGRKKDILVKIAAVLTVSIGIWAGVVLSGFLLCGIVYGFDGLKCYNGMALNYLFPWPERMIPMFHFLLIALLLSFFGILFLCAVTVYVSACCKSIFHAVVATMVCWGAPVLIEGLFDGTGEHIILVAYTPVFMVLNAMIEKIYHVWPMLMGIAIICSFLFTIGAYRKYEKQQII